MIVVHFFKHIEQHNLDLQNDTRTESSGWPVDKNGSLLFFMFVSTIGSYTLYFGIGGFLHVFSFINLLNLFIYLFFAYLR